MSTQPTKADLIAFAKSVLPIWFSEENRSDEELNAFAEIAEDAAEIIAFWLSQTLIGEAQGPTGTEPDWLNQHAIDRATSRQEGESDEALSYRLRNVPDAITRDSLLDAIQAILDADGIAGTPYLLELRRDKAFLTDFTSDSGTGGTFTTGGGSTFRFEPAAGWARPPYWDAIFPEYGYQLVFSGAIDANNNGTFATTGIHENAAEYTNASGVERNDPGVSWTAQKLDQDGNVADGYVAAYIDRGYRVSHSSRSAIIVILPYGSTAGTAASVQEMLRQKRGAGVFLVVERRLVP